MGLEELLAAQQRIVEMLRAEGKAHGGLMASALQLVDHLSAKLAGQVSELEHTIQIKVEGQSGVMERVADQFVQSMEGMLMRETKTAGRIYDAFAKKHMEQLELDMIAAIFGIQQRWRLASEEDLADSENYRVKKLQEAQKLLAETYGWTQAEFRVALSNFGFEDSLRELVMAPVERLVAPVGEITKKAQEDLHQGIDETLENFDEWIGDALRPAIDETFSEDGPLTQDALKAVRNSPDFGPAMEVLFGPDGTLAQAARGATEQANLEPALDGFEEKIESGVTAALDEAGTKAQAHAVASLGSKVKEGVGALGGALSAVGGLGTSVIALGAAWDKPNKGAADYFGLMSQLGGTISQGLGAVDAIAKLAGVTKIAAAAQAVFNAVMAINPVVLIVIAVVALIAALALLIIYWDQVKAAVRDNPWIGIAVVLLGIIAPIFGIIAAVIMLIAYWDEVKLAFLQGANFMSIQLQKIGGFFLGLQNLIGMVWDWIVASVYNLGAGIINGYIEFGAGINITPNGAKVLNAFGLGDEARPVGERTALERLGQQHGIDLVVAGEVDRAEQVARDERIAGAHLLGRPRLDAAALRAEPVEDPLRVALLLLVVEEVEEAGADLRLDVEAGRREQLLREPRETVVARAEELHEAARQRLGAGLGGCAVAALRRVEDHAAAQPERFAERPQPAGRGRRRAAGRRGVEQRDRRAAAREEPGDAGADRPAADDDHVAGARRHGAILDSASSPSVTGRTGGRGLAGPADSGEPFVAAATSRATPGQHEQPWQAPMPTRVATFRLR